MRINEVKLDNGARLVRGTRKFQNHDVYLGIRTRLEERPVVWLYEGTQRIGYVIEAWDSGIYPCRERNALMPALEARVALQRAGVTPNEVRALFWPEPEPEWEPVPEGDDFFLVPCDTCAFEFSTWRVHYSERHRDRWVSPARGGTVYACTPCRSTSAERRRVFSDDQVDAWQAFMLKLGAAYYQAQANDPLENDAARREAMRAYADKLAQRRRDLISKVSGRIVADATAEARLVAREVDDAERA